MNILDFMYDQNVENQYKIIEGISNGEISKKDFDYFIEMNPNFFINIYNNNLRYLNKLDPIQSKLVKPHLEKEMINIFIKDVYHLGENRFYIFEGIPTKKGNIENVTKDDKIIIAYFFDFYIKIFDVDIIDNLIFQILSKETNLNKKLAVDLFKDYCSFHRNEHNLVVEVLKILIKNIKKTNYKKPLGYEYLRLFEDFFSDIEFKKYMKELNFNIEQIVYADFLYCTSKGNQTNLNTYKEIFKSGLSTIFIQDILNKLERKAKSLEFKKYRMDYEILLINLTKQKSHKESSDKYQSFNFNYFKT